MDSEKNGSLYWIIARRNYAVYMTCQGYLARHPHAFLKKWNCLRRAAWRFRSLRGTEAKEISTASLCRLIDSFEVISFDIFDTLLCRNVQKPRDVFRSVQEEQHATGFYDARIRAEQRARRMHPKQEDVTFRQIYQELPEQYRGLEQAELDAEKAAVYANAAMAPVYQHALQAGKRVILCSDMYLTRDFLEKLLQNSGFGGYEKLYLSSELMKTKGTGHLFHHVVQDTETAPEKILHIGDHLESDGTAAILGMGFVHVVDGRFFEVKRR
ncbi:MAG: hypothetical protein K6G16_06740 [Lachnospiraceae bacterium]|nr:hypothetical protein [Lachnospiraceae bacterium]